MNYKDILEDNIVNDLKMFLKQNGYGERVLYKALRDEYKNNERESRADIDDVLIEEIKTDFFDVIDLSKGLNREQMAYLDEDNDLFVEMVEYVEKNITYFIRVALGDFRHKIDRFFNRQFTSR